MNDTKTLTLPEFLLARIAEDEAVARATEAERHAWWSDRSLTTASNDGIAPGDRVHIARWSPARVLAACEAKRQMIERVGNPNWAGFNILALPYADHPGYLPEWRP